MYVLRVYQREIRYCRGARVGDPRFSRLPGVASAEAAESSVHNGCSRLVRVRGGISLGDYRRGMSGVRESRRGGDRGLGQDRGGGISGLGDQGSRRRGVGGVRGGFGNERGRGGIGLGQKRAGVGLG